MHSLGLATFAVVMSAVIPVSAQEASGLRDFCADRPGKGTPTCILDQGHWQLELGLFDGARQRDQATRSESWSSGDVWLRYGLSSRTEVQFGVTAWTRDEATDRTSGFTDRADGVGDITLGFRRALTDPDGDGPSAALAGWASLPTGSDEVSADRVDFGFVVPIAIPLDENWELALSPGVDFIGDGDGDGTHAAYALVVGVGRSFGPWALGAELWGQSDDDPGGSTFQSTANLTAVWTPPFAADAQVDFGINFGLNHESPDVEFGVGLAKRF